MKSVIVDKIEYFLSEEKPNPGDNCLYMGKEVIPFDKWEIWDKDKCQKIIHSQEAYNPEKHCCRRWYKDYCDCYSEAIKKERDRMVNTTLQFLEEHNIPYEGSKISNVVVLNADTQPAYLSLKKKRGVFFNVRFQGHTKWYGMGEKKFLKTFKTYP